MPLDELKLSVHNNQSCNGIFDCCQANFGAKKPCLAELISGVDSIENTPSSRIFCLIKSVNILLLAEGISVFCTKCNVTCLLLFKVFSTGSTAFFKTTIQTEVDFDKKLL